MTVNEETMKPLGATHYILELLRDTELKASEIAEELDMSVEHTSTILSKLLKQGHIVAVRKERPESGLGASPSIYTSNYDKLKVKVYLTKDDVHYNIRESEKIELKRDPLVDAFFGSYVPKPTVVEESEE
jgi:transcription initiation factor IIE alpha subunit